MKMKKLQLITMAALVASLAWSGCKKDDDEPAAPATPVAACETNQTGELIVRNDAPDPYRLYYKKDTPDGVEQLWGVVQPNDQHSITLPTTVYLVRIERESGSGSPQTASTYRYVPQCDVAIWSFP